MCCRHNCCWNLNWHFAWILSTPNRAPWSSLTSIRFARNFLSLSLFLLLNSGRHFRFIYLRASVPNRWAGNMESSQFSKKLLELFESLNLNDDDMLGRDVLIERTHKESTTKDDDSNHTKRQAGRRRGVWWRIWIDGSMYCIVVLILTTPIQRCSRSAWVWLPWTRGLGCWSKTKCE